MSCFTAFSCPIFLLLHKFFHHLICTSFLCDKNPVIVCPHEAANLVAVFEAILDVNAHSSCFPTSLHIPEHLFGYHEPEPLGLHASLSDTFVKVNLLSTFSKVASLSRLVISGSKAARSSLAHSVLPRFVQYFGFSHIERGIDVYTLTTYKAGCR